jgi:hypothetical protein
VIKFSDLKVGMIVEDAFSSKWEVISIGDNWACVKRSDRSIPCIVTGLEWINKICRPAYKVFVALVKGSAGQISAVANKDEDFLVQWNGYKLISKKEIEIEEGEGLNNG